MCINFHLKRANIFVLTNHGLIALEFIWKKLNSNLQSFQQLRLSILCSLDCLQYYANMFLPHVLRFD